ncbi:MAG: DUF3108 domain-containing protein, partial [Verrucomicrobiota bacterium]|nr:DUF3108 domain-containing protein [Verrucomicrobiota bacterium]
MHRLSTRLMPLLGLFFMSFAKAENAPLALRPGEVFVYRVGWGILGGAGEIKISAHAETLEGLPQLHLITMTRTRGLVYAFFPFTGEADSIFDARSGRLLAMRASSNSGHTRTDASIVFDYDHGTASYINYVHPERNNPALPVPAGNPMDLITSLIQARTYVMKPGDKRPVLVIFDNEFYELTIAADHYEQIESPLGEFNTLVLVP